MRPGATTVAHVGRHRGSSLQSSAVAVAAFAIPVLLLLRTLRVAGKPTLLLILLSAGLLLLILPLPALRLVLLPATLLLLILSLTTLLLPLLLATLLLLVAARLILLVAVLVHGPIS